MWATETSVNYTGPLGGALLVGRCCHFFVYMDPYFLYIRYAHFLFTISYRPGPNNGKVDVLSQAYDPAP